MKLAIGIATYRRKDGKTKDFLTKALTSVKNQNHQDYKVFLIGDKYEDEEEFIEISTSILDHDKIYFENLKFAQERDKYSRPQDAEKLWSSGGVFSMNYATQKALEEGFEWICHLDHDDAWLPNHLLNFSNFIESYPGEDLIFLASRCNYLGLHLVPAHSYPGFFNPTPGDLVHSSACINFSKIPLRYRDVYAETGEVCAADADLWQRITGYMRENNLFSYLIADPTVVYYKKERS